MSTLPIYSDNELRFFRSRASQYAVYGTIIASISVIIATLLVSFFIHGSINLNGIIVAQKTNVALWTMDAMPFLFAIWGQYSSVRMAREASNIVDNKTKSLIQALSEARFTSQTKSDFFAKLSHEFRTPISGIIGMTDLMLESNLSEEQKRYSKVIKTSAVGLLTLVNDILDYSKIEAGKLELEQIDFDFRECIESAVEILRLEAEKRGLELITISETNIPERMVGDPGRLRQIIINLVGNAIKFTETGKVKLTAKQIKQDRDGYSMLQVEVMDTGMGISKKAQANLFDTYSQAKSSTTREFGGTGLGLSITKDLVEAMGGGISVKSKENQGSTFTFTAVLKQSASSELSKNIDKKNLKGLRILVADENKNARSVLIEILEKQNYVVEAVSDGVSALGKILSAAQSGQPFDLLLTDMFLPQRDGEHLGKEIKARPETRDIVIAMVTSAGARGDAKRLNNIGFAGYFGKPIPAEVVPDLVAAVMATRGLSESERQRNGLVTKYTLAEMHRAKKRVLLADDSEVNREIIIKQLAKKGLQTDIVVNGKQALEAVQKTRYGLVLMDLRMPEMDGMEALKNIRGLSSESANVSIVILTAGASDSEIEDCKKNGANDVLIKPIDADVFTKILSRWLSVNPSESLKDTKDPVDAKNEQDLSDTQLIKIYLDESSQRMRALRQAVTNSDAPSIALEAHTLRSASAHMQDSVFTETAARMEKLANAGDLESAALMLEELELAEARLRPELERRLAK